MKKRELIALLLVLPAVAGRAQYWAEQVIPPPLDVTSTAQFGWSLSIEGDYLLVGAPGSDDEGANAGAAYIFRREEGGTNDWDLLTRLAPPLLSDNAAFGTTVLLRDGRAFVGATHQRIGLVEAGAVYVFDQHNGGDDAWGYVQRLTSPEPGIGQLFGSFITASTDTVIIGMPGSTALNTSGQPLTGGYSAFRMNTDGTATIIGSACVEFLGRAGILLADRFIYAGLNPDGFSYLGYQLGLGELLALNGSVAPAPTGAPLILAWPNGNPLGSAFPNMNILCGPQLAVSGQNCAISDLQYNEPDTQMVVMFTLDGSGEPQLSGCAFPPAVLDPDPHFGESIALTCCMLVVGAPGTVTAPTGSVQVYDPVMDPSGVLPLRTILYPTNPGFGDLFGWSLAAQDGTIATGSPGHGSDDRGQVHVFLDPTTGTPDAQGTSDGSLLVWPNPASGSIAVRSPWPIVGGEQVELIDVTGRSVLRAQMRRTVERIDTDRLAPGPYTLILTGGTRTPARASAHVIIHR